MPHLIHVIASPSGRASRSRQVADRLVQAWRLVHAEGTFDEIDVWSLALPAFDREMIAAKFAVLRQHDATPTQQAIWASAVQLAERFNAADRFVFSVPMWNFGLPYRLKHFIDVVTLPGQNWRWSPQQGYEGLLLERRAAIVYSSAGAHPLPPYQTAVDHQKGHMRAWLSFLGISDVHEFNIGPTLDAPDAVEQRIDEVGRQAASFGERF